MKFKTRTKQNEERTHSSVAVTLCALLHPHLILSEKSLDITLCIQIKMQNKIRQLRLTRLVHNSLTIAKPMVIGFPIELGSSNLAVCGTSETGEPSAEKNRSSQDKKDEQYPWPLARARTQTARFGDEHTNHEATAPPHVAK